MSATEPVSVHILDREYTVGVQADEHDSLLAALNLAHELQQLRDEQQARNREVERTLQDLHRKLDSALGTP